MDTGDKPGPRGEQKTAARQSGCKGNSLDWKSGIRFLAAEVRVIARVLKHPGSPWPARLIAGAATAYILSPIQLIPTIIPVIGQLDDAFVIVMAMRIIRRITPEMVVAECSGTARTSASSLQHKAALRAGVIESR